jgi:hypothetical protein
LDAFIDLPGRKVLDCEIDDEHLAELNTMLAVAGAAVDAAAKQRGLKLARPNVNITFEEGKA